MRALLKWMALPCFLLLLPAAVAGRSDQVPADSHALAAVSVEELVAAMKRSNLQLQAAGQRLEQAEGRLRQRSLYLNPRVELDEKTDRLGSGRGARETEFALVQPVELGGKRAARIHLGEAEREMVRFEIADLERRLTAELRLRAGEALAAAARLRALDEAAELQQRMQQAVVLRVSAGDASRFEAALSEAETARLRSEREGLAGQLESALAEIRLTAGMAADAPLVLRDPQWGQASGVSVNGARQAARPAADAMVEQALAARPDLQAARWRATMAEHGLRLARANAFPDVGVLVGFKQEQSPPDAAGLSPNSNWLFRFGVTVGLPIFQRNQGTRQETAALLAEARLAANFAEQAVRRDVALSVRRLELAQNALRLVRTRLLPETESTARMARTGYELGELSLPQLILEQRRLVEARSALIQANLDAYRARVELARALAQ